MLVAFTSFSSQMEGRTVHYTIVEVDVSRPTQPFVVQHKLAPIFQPPYEVRHPKGLKSVLTPNSQKTNKPCWNVTWSD